LDGFSEAEQCVAIEPSAASDLRFIRSRVSHPEIVVIRLEPVESLDCLKGSKHNPRVVLSLVPSFDSDCLIEVCDFAHI